jgi:hypothetical protein
MATCLLPGRPSVSIEATESFLITSCEELSSFISTVTFSPGLGGSLIFSTVPMRTPPARPIPHRSILPPFSALLALRENYLRIGQFA